MSIRESLCRGRECSLQSFQASRSMSGVPEAPQLVQLALYHIGKAGPHLQVYVARASHAYWRL
jgi:hypothetical protein